ncbi:MAG: hypothetical protein CVU84_15635 [Firmicutes bacterium HGW-Firmicutes-1]|jgi:predicted PurR-regulated permease PerM|nr:MAG: hypothetical protein CVU84_15635 [Firmicutes bacterium HGW-Firmicutes-1]
MNQKKDFSFIKYLLFATVVICIAKFIFAGKIGEVTVAFKPFIYASIFIYLFGPIVDYLNKKTKLDRIWCILISYITFFIFLGLFLLMIVPSLIDSVQLLINNLSTMNEDNIIALLKDIPIVSNYIDYSTLSNFVNDMEEFVISYSSNILKYSSNILSSIGSVLITIILLLFAICMSFYALRDTQNISEKMEDIVHAFFTQKTAYHIIRIAKLTDTAIKKYLIGKLYTCLILGICTGLAIVIVNIVTPLHIPYVPLIAVIIGISNIIPYVGSILGTIPCIIMALFSGFWEGIVLLLIVIIIQQIDNIIITPKIIGDSVGLQPFWVIVAITAGGSLFGVIGMVVSVPIVSVILHLVEERVVHYNQHLESKKE